MALEILHLDEDLVIVEKPEGVHVHPPEDRRTRLTYDQNALAVVRDQLGKYLYPVHRLDPATSGVLAYALSSEAAAAIQAQFRAGTVKKRYWAVVRGHLVGPSGESDGVIERELRRDGVGTLARAETEWSEVARCEAGWSVGQFPQARYMWLEARPRTGVYHQIRRHFAGLSRPIIGDRAHGDGLQNRVFTERTGIPGLCLRAISLELAHPRTGAVIRVEKPASEKWQKMEEALPWRKRLL